jgi:hypothetical protein
VVWVRDSEPIPDPVQFLQEFARSNREKYLKTDRDFAAGQVRSAVDLEGMKPAAGHPQDLASLLGLGLQLKPNIDRSDLGWEADRYLLNPIVLDGYDQTN